MKILAVCLGNICRSPLAEGILKAKLPGNFIIDSAGTISQHEGQHPDKRAMAVAKKHGYDISEQRSRPITEDDFENFDHLFCMDVSIYEDVISMAKNDEHRNKVSLFLRTAEIAENNYEVFDPYWSEMDGFEKVIDLIERASDNIKAKISNNQL